MATSPDLVLLYDGLCGFCNKTVQFILHHDRGGTMCFAPLQGVFAKDLLARHPNLRDIDSLILVRREAGALPEAIAVRSEALLQIADYLGGVWRTFHLLRVLPLVLRDWAYDGFARFRYRLFGRHVTCPVPSSDDMARFLH